jgi:hypothetical protein
MTDTVIDSDGVSLDLRAIKITGSTIYLSISDGTINIAKWVYNNVF